MLQKYSYTAWPAWIVIGESKWALFSVYSVWTVFCSFCCLSVYRHIFPLLFGQFCMQQQSRIDYAHASFVHIYCNVKWKSHCITLLWYSMVQIYSCSSVFPAYCDGHAYLFWMQTTFSKLRIYVTYLMFASFAREQHFIKNTRVILYRVANITDFAVEVRNLENYPYFSRFLYGVSKVSDFLGILKVFDIFQHFFYHN